MANPAQMNAARTEGKPVGREESAKRGRPANYFAAQSRRNTERRNSKEVWPSDGVCFKVVHRFLELCREVPTENGEEIDDVCARELQRYSDVPLSGLLVQRIIGLYAEQRVRDLEAYPAYLKNATDAARQSHLRTFAEAPGRSF